MTTPNTHSTPIPDYPAVTQQALVRLREAYGQLRDLFTRQELAHLGYVRWLYPTSRLLPWGRHPWNLRPLSGTPSDTTERTIR